MTTLAATPFRVRVRVWVQGRVRSGMNNGGDDTWLFALQINTRRALDCLIMVIITPYSGHYTTILAVTTLDSTPDKILAQQRKAKGG